MLRLSFNWLRNNLGKKHFFKWYLQLQNISNEGLCYGNDALIAAAETHLIKQLSAKFNKDTIVFDVGANVGDYAAQWLPVTHCIYAFEPKKETYELLHLRMQSKIITEQMALGSAKGNLHLYETTDHRLHSLVAREHANYSWEKGAAVQVDTLDNYCAANAIRNIDFLKIDTEGYEMEVLKGAAGMLKNISYIQFEFGGASLAQKVSFKNFYDLLHPQFKIYFMLIDGIHEIATYHEKLENYTGNNFLAININGV